MYCLMNGWRLMKKKKSVLISSERLLGIDSLSLLSMYFSLKGKPAHQHMFEARGPGGCLLLIEALTDNHSRSQQDIKRLLIRNGSVWLPVIWLCCDCMSRNTQTRILHVLSPHRWVLWIGTLTSGPWIMVKRTHSLSLVWMKYLSLYTVQISRAT